MSLRFLRSRFFSVASKRFLCTNAAPATPQPSPPSVTSPNRWNFLKYAVIGAFTGTTVLTGYASYGSFFPRFLVFFLNRIDLEMMICYM
jgi:import inner membrane translocase subunit TIM50